MLPHLTRKQPADRPWAAADLDAAAEFWLRLYEAAARAVGYAPALRHATEVRLRGFPRAEAALLTAELARRAAGSDFVNPEVGPHGDDALYLASGFGPADEAPPVGLGVPLLAGPGFDGLVAEVRLRVVGEQRKLFRRSTVEGTLVLVGEVRGGRLLLKSAWRTGSSGWEDDVFWHSPWPDEAGWFAALDRYREAEEVPAALAKKVFVVAGADAFGGLVVKLLRAPLGRPRLGGLVLRWLTFLALLAGTGLLVGWLVERRMWPALVPAGGWAVMVVLLFLTFLRNEARLLFGGYREFRLRYGKLYEGTVRHVPLTADAGAAPADAWSRKYTADLTAAGFAHAGDLRLENAAGGGAVRVFRCPDGSGYLSMLVMTATHADPAEGFRMWPAQVVFLGQTFFPDGGRVVTLSGRSIGYRKKRTGPETAARIIPDAADPLEVARAHAAAAARFAAETGRRPVGHERFDLYVRRQEGLHEEERRLYADHPYTWGDHLHWYLQSIRKEYRG